MAVASSGCDGVNSFAAWSCRRSMTRSAQVSARRSRQCLRIAPYPSVWVSYSEPARNFSLSSFNVVLAFSTKTLRHRIKDIQQDTRTDCKLT